MFNPSTAIVVIAIGVFAGYFFDGERKNHDMVWLGIFILVFTPLMIGAKYGFNWGIAGLIEVIAGIGLYKMFFYKMFKGGHVAEEQIQDTNVSKIEPSTNEEPKGEYKNGKKHGKWTGSLGELHYETNFFEGQIHGKKTVFINDRKIEEEDWLNGSLNGASCMWYENGQKQLEEYYNHGVLEKGTYWDKDGKKCSKDDLGLTYDEEEFGW